MTDSFVDPQTIHKPETGSSPPASWGDVVRSDLVMLANRPGCLIQRDTNQAIPHNTVTPVEFTGTDLRDTDDFHNPASNPSRITIPAGLGGLYRVGANWMYAAHANATTRTCRVRVNGTTTVGSLDIPAIPAANTTVAVDVMVPLAAGDYIEFLAYQPSGGPLNISIALPCRAYAIWEAL